MVKKTQRTNPQNLPDKPHGCQKI